MADEHWPFQRAFPEAGFDVLGERIECHGIDWRAAAVAEEIKRDRAAIKFAEGLIMGVMAETPDNVRDYFWRESPEIESASSLRIS